MTANLLVRNLDDEIIARLKERAMKHGRSAEAEHREILRLALINEASSTFDELAAKIRAMTPHDKKPTSSEVLLRESRDER